MSPGTEYGRGTAVRRVSLLPVLLCTVALVAVAPSTCAGREGGAAALAAAGLDTVHLLSDPLIRELAELGEPVIPHVISRLDSPRKMTSSAAVRVLAYIGGDVVVNQLLEYVETAATERERDRAADALRRVLDRMSTELRSPDPEQVEPEFEDLARAAVCSGEGLPQACVEEYRESGMTPLLLYGDGVSTAYDLGCFEGGIQILATDAFLESSYLVGRGYVRLDLTIRDLEKSSAGMPAWIRAHGYKPEAVAMVDVRCGAVGPESPIHGRATMWARSRGVWSVVATAYELTVN